MTISRREFLSQSALGSLAFASPSALSDQVPVTKEVQSHLN
ncbi:hypothetical protein ACFFJX_15620 [Pseudarcicella hirudinis]